jgi:hypothetical protein
MRVSRVTRVRGGSAIQDFPVFDTGWEVRTYTPDQVANGSKISKSFWFPWIGYILESIRAGAQRGPP